MTSQQQKPQPTLDIGVHLREARRNPCSRLLLPRRAGPVGRLFQPRASAPEQAPRTPRLWSLLRLLNQTADDGVRFEAHRLAFGRGAAAVVRAPRGEWMSSGARAARA